MAQNCNYIASVGFKICAVNDILLHTINSSSMEKFAILEKNHNFNAGKTREETSRNKL